MYAVTLASKHTEKKLTLSAAELGENAVQITFQAVDYGIFLTLTLNKKDLNIGVGTIRTKNDTIKLTNQRLVVKQAGLEASWLISGWENGEESMVALVNWLKSKTKQLV
jgi:hypothetical protein